MRKLFILPMLLMMVLLLSACEADVIPVFKNPCPPDAYCVGATRGNGTIWENVSMNSSSNGTYTVVVSHA